jgi:hypothetical protein
MLCSTVGCSCFRVIVFGIVVVFGVMFWFPWVVAMVGLLVVACSVVAVWDIGVVVGFVFVGVMVVVSFAAVAFVVGGTVSFFGVIRKTCIGDPVLPRSFLGFLG